MLTPYANILLLDFLYNTEVVTRPTAWYVALHTDDPSDTGTANEVTVGIDADYVRQSVAFDSAIFSTGRGIVFNNNVLTWTPATGSDYLVSAVSVWDAETDGNCLAQGLLIRQKTATPAVPVTLSSGKLPLVMNDMPEYAAILGMNFLFNAEIVTRPTAWYYALHMADPGYSGDENEVTSNEDISYARQTVTYAAAAPQVSNDSGASWTPGAGADYVISHRTIQDALTGGNCLAMGQLYQPETGLADIPVAIAIGDDAITMRI